MSKFTIGFGMTSINGSLNEVTVEGSYQIKPSDNIIYVDNKSGAPIDLFAPEKPVAKQFLMIKDVAGNFSQFNVTFHGLVDRVENPVFATDDGGAILIWNESIGRFNQHA